MTWANWQYASLVCGTNQLPTQTAPHQRRHRSRRNRRKSPKLKRRGRIRAAPTREGLRHPQPTRRTRSRHYQTTSRPSRSPRPTQNQATPGPSPSSSKGSIDPASGAFTTYRVRRRPQVQDAHVHLWRRVPLRPGPLLLRPRRGRAAAAAGAVVAARVQDEALPLRRFRVPLLRRRPLPVRAHGPRAGVPSRTESRMCTAAGRGAPVRAAAAGEDAGPEVQDAHVPLRRGRVPLRRELLLRAQRRRFPRGTQLFAASS